MSKGKLELFLCWVPRPEKPLTTTINCYIIPTTILIAGSIVLSPFFLPDNKTRRR